jgi:hypothetical protein
MLSAPTLYTANLLAFVVLSMRVACVEAGSNTSTVTLRVVGGDGKGIIKSETVQHGRETLGTRPENDCAGKDQQQL